jgi:hypothetical protein
MKAAYENVDRKARRFGVGTEEHKSRTTRHHGCYVDVDGGVLGGKLDESVGSVCRYKERKID